MNCVCIVLCRRFEVETVAMTASMLHGDANVVGSVTSGGTESILCAVKAYRDRARHLHPRISQPEMVSTSLSVSFTNVFSYLTCYLQYHQEHLISLIFCLFVCCHSELQE